MNKTFGILIVTSFFILQRPVFAVDAAPHISDWEIVEGLAEIRGDIKRLDDGQKSMDSGLNKRIDDLDSKLSTHISDLDSKLSARISDLDANLNARIDGLDAKLGARIDGFYAELKGDMKRLEDGQKAMDKRLDDLRSEMNGKFADLRDEMNHRFDALQWMFGLFVTIALVILGFVLRMQWQMHRRQTQVETVLQTQREELGFIRRIIEKVLPPRGAL